MNNTDLEKKIRTIISELSDQKGYITTVDVLMKLEYLSKGDYENWRFGKVEYLEKVCKANLSKLTTVSKIIKKIAGEMKLKPSWTGYNKFGKGDQTRLRFSKSGTESIENGYSTHYVNEFQIEKLKKIGKILYFCLSSVLLSILSLSAL